MADGIDMDVFLKMAQNGALIEGEVTDLDGTKRIVVLEKTGICFIEHPPLEHAAIVCRQHSFESVRVIKRLIGRGATDEIQKLVRECTKKNTPPPKPAQ